jgi:hypothetical protein
MSTQEFITYVTRFESQSLVSGSGVSQIASIYEYMRASGRQLHLGVANRHIYRLPANDAQPECNVWTLSPSDAEIQRFLARVGAMLPQLKQTKFRAVTSHLNDFSVVTFVEVNDTCILLGADLEQRQDSNRGWKAVVANDVRPQKMAEVFKVPHHGSKSGHNHDVWTKMLSANAYSLVTPRTLAGKRLPGESDVSRINEYTKHGYITSLLNLPKSKSRRPKAVERTIREVGVKLQQLEPDTGFARLRHKLGDSAGKWSVELSPRASTLIKAIA